MKRQIHLGQERREGNGFCRYYVAHASYMPQGRRFPY